MATGIADRIIRNKLLAIIILGLVCQTNRKKRGRFHKYLNLCFQVNGTAALYALAVSRPFGVFDLSLPFGVLAPSLAFGFFDLAIIKNITGSLLNGCIGS